MGNVVSAEAESLFTEHYGYTEKTVHAPWHDIKQSAQIAAARAQPQELVIWEQEDGTPAFEDLPWRVRLLPTAPLLAPDAMMRVFIAMRDGDRSVLYHVVGWDSEKGEYIADRMG